MMALDELEQQALHPAPTPGDLLILRDRTMNHQAGIEGSVGFTGLGTLPDQLLHIAWGFRQRKRGREGQLMLGPKGLRLHSERQASQDFKAAIPSSSVRGLPRDALRHMA